MRPAPGARRAPDGPAAQFSEQGAHARASQSRSNCRAIAERDGKPTCICPAIVPSERLLRAHEGARGRGDATPRQELDEAEQAYRRGRRLGAAPPARGPSAGRSGSPRPPAAPSGYLSAAAKAIIAPLSVHSCERREVHRAPRVPRGLREALAQAAVRAHAAGDHQRARALRGRAPAGTWPPARRRSRPGTTAARSARVASSRFSHRRARG